LLLASLAACTPARREVEGRIVRNTHFFGNGGLNSGNNDYQLRHQMQQQASPLGVVTWPLLYWVTPEVLQDDLLPSDAYRLEMWYAHHGWFDARVLGWEIREKRPAKGKRAGVVDLYGSVEPGPPSLVRGIALNGLEGGFATLARVAFRLNGFEEGVQFDLDTIDQVQSSILSNLQNQAHAYAGVTSSIQAFPADHAVDVTFDVDPGIAARFGPVTVTGNDKVKTKYIEDNLAFDLGDAYKKKDLADTQQALFGLGTFSVVSVEPDLSDPTRTDVPVNIKVTEAPFRTVRVGGGATFDNVIVTPDVTLRFKDTNLFRTLMVLDTSATLGLTYSADGVTGISAPKPLYDVTASLNYPRFFFPKVSIEGTGEIQQQQAAGLWLYQNPKADLAIVWKFLRGSAFRFGPHYEVYKYLIDTPDSLQFAKTVFGKNFTNPYSLTSFDQHLTVDLRDDPLSPTRGEYASVFTREAFPLRTDGYQFLQSTVEGRIYRPLGAIGGDLPLVGALRLRGQYLYPLEGRALPYPSLAFLGGNTNLRGFRTNGVGPYDTLCTYGDTDHDPNTPEVATGKYPLAHGGDAAIDGSAELRYGPNAWSYVAFVDGGWLAESVNNPDLQVLRWDVGVGARYKSAIGPIRVDVAFRPLFPEDSGPTEVIGCNPGDDPRRYFDMISLFGAYPPDRIPVAVQVFLAIGEAF
jgi:translocation and assembly module TamA